MPESHASRSHTTVFFDGVCGLCNGFVDFLVQRDRGRRLRYAPLQGTTAAQLALLQQLPRDLDSVVVVEGTRMRVKSDAALHVLAQLGGAWRAATLLRVIPRLVRDGVYDVIARNRYGWFGRRETCRIPAPDEAPWFLP